MKKLIVTTAVCALLTGAAFAQEGPWMVRARAVGIDMANKDATDLGLTVNNKTIPEIDITYFFNKNVHFSIYNYLILAYLYMDHPFLKLPHLLSYNNENTHRLILS